MIGGKFFDRYLFRFKMEGPPGRLGTGRIQTLVRAVVRQGQDCQNVFSVSFCTWATVRPMSVK